jgi:hypothetical protein
MNVLLKNSEQHPRIPHDSSKHNTLCHTSDPRAGGENGSLIKHVTVVITSKLADQATETLTDSTKALHNTTTEDTANRMRNLAILGNLLLLPQASGNTRRVGRGWRCKQSLPGRRARDGNIKEHVPSRTKEMRGNNVAAQRP